MTVQDLGTQDGDLLLFGGPYSNLHALKALIAIAGVRGIAAEQMICTGDVVAYAAHAEETTQAIIELGCAVVAGNCEEQLGEGAQDCGCGFEDGTACDLLSARWFAHASAALSSEACAWMRACPKRVVFRHHGQRYAVIHGGARSVNSFIWPSCSAALKTEEIDALEAEIGAVDAVICGHSGIGFTETIATETVPKRWINAGVIGMPPHSGDARTEYALLSSGQATLHRLSYDHGSAADAMISAGLTTGYERSLTSGWWPSEDVLPKALRVGITSLSPPADDARKRAS